MASLKVFLVLTLAQYVLCDNADRIVDPLIVQSAEVNVPNEAGLVITYKNLNITGLDSRELLEHRIDTTANSVFLKVKVKLHIVGDIEIQLTKKDKILSGGYSLETTVVEKIEYTYTLKDDEEGIPRLIINKEKLTCESYGTPKIEVSKELEDAFKTEPLEEAGASQPKIEDLNNVRQHMLWKLLDVTFGTLVDTYRDGAKKIPATNFLESIQKFKN